MLGARKASNLLQCDLGQSCLVTSAFAMTALPTNLLQNRGFVETFLWPVNRPFFPKLSAAYPQPFHAGKPNPAQHLLRTNPTPATSHPCSKRKSLHLCRVKTSHIRNISTALLEEKRPKTPKLAAHKSTAVCRSTYRTYPGAFDLSRCAHFTKPALGQLLCHNLHACQSPVILRYRNLRVLCMHCSMTSHSPLRPICPKCGMNMIRTPKTGARQAFECLRCGHLEQKAPSKE
jgi:hypothetical protein